MRFKFGTYSVYQWGTAIKIALLMVWFGGIILAPLRTANAAELPYSDLPADSWARDVVYAARAYGLMEGSGEGIFGYGLAISRAEFITILCRMLDWELLYPSPPSFADVSPEQWYYPYVETALHYDVIPRGERFFPQDPIMREDMAVMLIKAFGYQELAHQVKSYGHPFLDVAAENSGYITMAYDIGMVSGVSSVSFAPRQGAKREEAAAMLVRSYERYIRPNDWLHGFYAFASYDQRYVTQSMDAVSLGWSQMCWNPETLSWLNTGSADDNPWRIPEFYESIATYLAQYGTKAHLNVYMDTTQIVERANGSRSNSLTELLRTEQSRELAVNAIIKELTRPYDTLGASPYSGVTIDFEGLQGQSVKADFNSFLTELASQLQARKLSLYVAVQPVTSDGKYNNGYDYRTIGELADRIILMAHDYAPTQLPETLLGTDWYHNTALTPIAEVYYALRAITDDQSGVADRTKLVLGISFSSLGWEISDDDRVLNTTPVSPSISTVHSRMLQSDTIQGWSETYRNPYLFYSTENGQKIFLWYEDQRSVSEKLKLAKLFGINGISLWRIGTIPDYKGVYDVWKSIPKSY